MELWIKLFMIIKIISFLLIELTESKTIEDYCDYRELEANIKSLLGVWVFKDIKWPENEAEMTEWCKSVQSDRRSAKKFVNNCLRGLPRPYMSVFINLAGRVSRTYCRIKQERINYIAKGKCGNRAKDDMNKCYHGMIELTKNIKIIKDSKHKIPALCCSVYWLKDCFINSFERIGPPVCSERNIEHMEQHYDKIASESIKIECSIYKDPGLCVPYIQQIEKPQSAVTHHNNNTYFPTLFEILETLEF